MKELLIILSLAIASAYAETCNPRTNLSQEFFDHNKVSIEFTAGFLPTPESYMTTFKDSNAWKKYWGTASYVTIDHASQAKAVPAGAKLEIDRAMHLEGDAGELLSSTMSIITLAENEYGLHAIKVFYQPYSNYKIKKLQKALNVTVYCD